MLEWESCHAKSHMDTVCPRYLEVLVKIPGDLQHIAEKKIVFLTIWKTNHNQFQIIKWYSNQNSLYWYENFKPTFLIFTMLPQYMTKELYKKSSCRFNCSLESPAFPSSPCKITLIKSFCIQVFTNFTFCTTIDKIFAWNYQTSLTIL